MTQLIVSIDNPSMVSEIRKAIKLMRGVVSVKATKEKPNPTTIAAIESAKNKDGFFCESFDDYIKLVSNLDNV